MFFFYTARTFTERVNGSRIKTVTCEKCATKFYYNLFRSAVGSGSAPYGIGQASARAGAHASAKRNLENFLQKDVELVPCPKCKWVNEDAVKIFRKSRFRNYPKYALLALLLTGVVDFIYCINAMDRRQLSPADPALCTLTIIGLATAVFWLWFQHYRRRRIDPNLLVNGVPNVPLGTPPALLELGTTTTGGFPTLVAASNQSMNPDPNALFAIFRSGQLTFESCCCVCLGDYQRTYTMPINPTKPLAAPVCVPCLRRLRWKWILFNFISIAVGAGLGGLVYLAFAKGVDSFACVFIIGAITLTFALITIFDINELVPPYRIRMIDKARSIWKISFRNPNYTAIIIRKINRTEQASATQSFSFPR